MRLRLPTNSVSPLLLLMVLLVTAGVTADADAAPVPGGQSASDPEVGPAAGRSRGGPVARGGGVRPVPGPLVRPFALPEGPFGAGHRGVDLAAQRGDQVVATLDGTVVFSGRVAGIGWVTVDHGGDLATTYGPLEHRRPTGTQVAAGDSLGEMGRSDDLPPTHLDWGARLRGDYIDPMLLLGMWQLRLTALHGDLTIVRRSRRGCHRLRVARCLATRSNGVEGAMI